MTIYTQTGPFNNGAGPGVSAGFLNNVESVLLGTLGLVKMRLGTGTLTAISSISGTGSGSAQTITHGLGTTPDIVLLTYAGNFGSPPTQVPYWFGANSTTVQVVAQAGYFYWGLCIKF